jgi:membrane fusion protein (multidrug efflux system)
VSQIDPILFRCAIAEAEYLKLARRRAGGAQDLRKQSNIELILADGTVHPHKGRLDAVERAVDAATGTLTGQFSFPNPERILRPSQYGRARFVIDVKQDALLVPQRAVQEIQGLYSVMVVKPDSTVEQRMVKAGETVGDVAIVDSGLKPGEKVIVEGIQKVQPGIKVCARTEKAADATSLAAAEPPADSGPQDAKRN